MIILQEKTSQKEGITNYDKAVSSSIRPKIVDVLKSQYMSNLKTAGTMMDTRRFAYAQVYGALSGIIGNLDIIDAATPTDAVKSLMSTLQKTKDAVQKGLSSLS
jgi:hypothetical protein